MKRDNTPGDEGHEPESGYGDEGTARRERRSESGFLTQYKPEQGRVVRAGTFIGAGLLILWGSYTLHTNLAVYAEGPDWWRQLISPGFPMAVAVALLAVIWRVSFVMVRTSDFLIATEGEMKKVNWSSKREVVGSTKVVIVFVILFGAILFVIDLTFQWLFTWMGVLKV